MYSTLPKSLKMELAVSVKVNKDPEEVEKRKKLCQERTPMELGNIGSLSELPIPAPIQNFFSKSEAADKPDKPKRKNMEEKRKYVGQPGDQYFCVLTNIFPSGAI